MNILGFLFKPKRKPIQEYLNERYGKLYDINDYMDEYACLYKLGRRLSDKPGRIMFKADAYPLKVYSDTLNIFIRN